MVLLDNEILLCNKKAELLYSHYELVTEVLRIGEAIDVSKYPQVVKLDKKNKTMTLELE